MLKFTEQNDHPVPCVDVVLFNDRDEILLERRAVEPQKGLWSIIGERVEVADNNMEATLRRGVEEETGFEAEVVNLVDVLADPRPKPLGDPRFYTVQVIYTARVIGGVLKSTEEASEFRWMPLAEARREKLAFNHRRILEIYQEKKEKGKLIPAKRRVFSDYFDSGFSYLQDIYPRFSAKAIILNDKKEILLARRVRPPFLGAWDFPGGNIYVNETIKQCIVREVKEELGVDCEAGDLFHVYSDKGSGPKFAAGMALYFVTIKSQNFVKNIEMGEFGYFPFDNLPKEIAYHNEGALADIRDYLEL